MQYMWNQFNLLLLSTVMVCVHASARLDDCHPSAASALNADHITSHNTLSIVGQCKSKDERNP
jgi:hypothetical protein